MSQFQTYEDAMEKAQIQAKNKTGISPTEYKVLIEPLAVQNKIGSVFLPDQEMDKQKYAQTKGTVIAVSPLAFTYVTKDEWEAAGAEPPKPGDTVLYAKYAGVTVKGRDGADYTLVNDKDICAKIEE